MRDAAVPMLRGGFFPFVRIALVAVAVAVMRFVMVAVVVLVERLMEDHVAERNDIESKEPKPTGDVRPMMLRPPYRDVPTQHAGGEYCFGPQLSPSREHQFPM